MKGHHYLVGEPAVISGPEVEEEENTRKTLFMAENVLAVYLLWKTEENEPTVQHVRALYAGTILRQPAVSSMERKKKGRKLQRVVHSGLSGGYGNNAILGILWTTDCNTVLV